MALLLPERMLGGYDGDPDGINGALAVRKLSIASTQRYPKPRRRLSAAPAAFLAVILTVIA